MDYLVSANRYEEEVSKKFDAILADNVFEHISNPIRWLKTLELMLKPEGMIFLRIPEYSACFDKYRQPTPFSHILTDYIRDVPDLDPEHSVEVGLYYDNEYKGQENDVESRLNLDKIMADYANPHFGVHCHTYSASTFVNQILKPMLALDLHELSFVELSVEKAAFTVVLQKRKSGTPLSWNEFVGKP